MNGRQIAEANLQGISDHWISMEDGSMSNNLEIKCINAINSLPNAFYKTMIRPLTSFYLKSQQIEYDGEPLTSANYGSQVRFYFRASFPDLNKINIEHAEIDFSPIALHVTQEILESVFEFFFPEGEAVTKPTHAEAPAASAGLEDRKYFSFVVVPAGRHVLSFKYSGELDSIADIDNFLIKLPSFEYHNQIWTWRELLLQLRKDAIFVLLRNAGSLFVDKLKKIGQSSIPEAEDSLEAFYRLEKLPSVPQDSKDAGTDAKEKESRLDLLFGSFHKKKKQ